MPMLRFVIVMLFVLFAALAASQPMQAAKPACQSYCLAEAVAFEQDCYWMVGDAAWCTQMGHDYYCGCRRGCDDGGNGPPMEISCN